MNQLIVPVRDRRQHRRILTMKNLCNALLGLIALCVVLTIAAAIRRPKPSDDFGRLYGRQLPSASEVPKQPEIIREAPVADVTSADPMLVAPAAREQILLGSNAPLPTTNMASAAQPVPMAGTRATIVGGPEGVSIVRQPEPRPVLSGGFGRQ